MDGIYALSADKCFPDHQGFVSPFANIFAIFKGETAGVQRWHTSESNFQMYQCLVEVGWEEEVLSRHLVHHRPSTWTVVELWLCRVTCNQSLRR
jgi:hypothetical protein